MNKKFILSTTSLALAGLALAGSAVMGGRGDVRVKENLKLDNPGLSLQTMSPSGSFLSSSTVSAKQEVERPEGVEEERILFEDFSQPIWQQGSEEDPLWDLSERDFEHADYSVEKYGYWWNWKDEITVTPGWGGRNVLPANGVACMNSEKIDKELIMSHLCTPTFDTSDYDGVVHARFKVRAQTGAPEGVYLLIEASETNNHGPSWNDMGSIGVKMTDEWGVVDVAFVGGGSSVCLNFFNGYAVNVYIDDIEIYSWKQPVRTPVALKHSNYEGSSFTANWNAVDGAEKYILNVYDLYGEPVMEPIETTETSYTVSNTDPTMDYMYGVCAVKGDYVSYESQRVSVIDVMKPSFMPSELTENYYTSNWAATPGDEILYNHLSYAQRTADGNGDFVIFDYDFNDIKLMDGSEPTFTIEDSDTHTYGASYPNFPQAGWRATNWMPYKGYVCVDAYHQCYNNSLSALLSPEFDLSGGNGVVDVELDLAAELIRWEDEETGKISDQFAHALITAFEWNEQEQEFVQVTDSKNMFFIEDTDMFWKHFKVRFTCGSKRMKIGICGVYAPGNLYIDNLRITQPLKEGEKFMDPYHMASFYDGTSLDVTHTNLSNELPLYHRMSSLRVTGHYQDGSFSYIESPYNDLEQVEGTDSYTTSIEGVEAIAEGTLSFVKGELAVVNPAGEKVVVTDLAGRMVFSSSDASISVRLPKGIYVVTMGKKALKLVY